MALHLAEGVEAASEETRALLFRMTRELLFNVVKHAETGQAAIVGKVERGQLVLSVRDEGKGFDKEVLKERPSGKGLREMGSRLEVLGGSVEIDSAPGKGTRVTIRMPRGAAAGG